MLPRRLRPLVLAALALAVLSASALALTVEDLIKMRDAGMGDSVLIKALETQGIDFEATPENLLKLKEKKFSDEVLVAVINAAAKRPPAGPYLPPVRPEPRPQVEPPPEESAPKPAPPKNPFLNRDKKCPQCGNRGLLVCPQHKVVELVVSSAMKEVPACCGGTGWVECPACHDELTRQAVEDLKKGLAERMALWKQMDRAFGRAMFHGESRHFSYDTDMNQAEAARVAATCEDLLIKLHETFNGDAFEFTRPADSHVITLGTVDALTRMAEWISTQARLNPETRMNLLKSTGMTIYGSQNWVINVRERAPDSYLNGIVHGCGHVLVNHVHGFKGRMPAWINEGFSSYCEGLSTGRPRTWCINYDPRDINPGVQWKESVRAAVQAGKTAGFEQLFGKSMNELAAIDYQQSWSVTAALIAGGPDKYLQFLQAIKNRTEPAEALEKAYGAKIDQIETAWKEVAKRP